MLVAMRKHTKVIFWVIIALLVPAFAVFYVPQQLSRRGPSATYGTMFGKTVTVDKFLETYRAEHRAVTDFQAAIMRMEHHKPQNDFLRARREVILAALANYEASDLWRQEKSAAYRQTPPQEMDLVPVETMREVIKREFTNPETGLYDGAQYQERLRELGMTDEQYVAERRDNYKVILFLSNRPLDQLTWERLLLAHEAKRLGITVSDTEVLSYLRVVCRGENGAIDKELYESRLRAVGKPRSEYEEEVRTTIRITKLQQMVLDSVKAPEQEVTERFAKRYGQFKLAYHLERAEPLMEAATLRDDQVISFYRWSLRYQRFADKYRIEPKTAVMYVLVETKGFRSQVEVTDADLEEYYTTHKTEFVADDGTPLPFGMCTKEVRAAVVEREAAKLARSTAARQLLVSSPARLIQQAAKHGYEVHRTPLFGGEGPIDELIGEDEEAFRTAALGENLERTRPAPGEVIGPVKVKQGWCIISPTQVVPDSADRIRPHYEVMGVARAEAARAKAHVLADEIATATYEEVREAMTADGLSFLDACAQLGVSVTETGFLTADDEIPGLEGGQDLVRWAAMGGRLEESVTEMARRPRDVYVRNLEEGTVFFDVVETRSPDAALRAERLPEFAHSKVLWVLQTQAYSEWLDALYGEASIIDLAAQQREREAQRQQENAPAQP